MGCGGGGLLCVLWTLCELSSRRGGGGGSGGGGTRCWSGGGESIDGWGIVCSWCWSSLIGTMGMYAGRSIIGPGFVWIMISFWVRPRFRGRLVPGGASRFTVQYEPKPGSVAGRC